MLEPEPLKDPLNAPTPLLPPAWHLVLVVIWCSNYQWVALPRVSHWSLCYSIADSMVFSVFLWNTVTEETNETILTGLPWGSVCEDFICYVSMKSINTCSRKYFTRDIWNFQNENVLHIIRNKIKCLELV